MKETLAGLGFDETPGLSFYGPKDMEIGKLSQPHWELANYLSVEQSFFRQTLLAGLFSSAGLNRGYFDEFDIFEIGRIFRKESGDQVEEKMKISGLVLDKNKSEKELYYSAKGRLEKFLEIFIFDKVEFHPAEKWKKQIAGEGFFQSVGLSALVYQGEFLGVLGLVHEKTAKAYGFKEKAAAFELDFEKIAAGSKKKKRFFSALRRFPSVKRDLAVLVDLKRPVAEIEKIIYSSGGERLEKAELFDVFENQKENKKSLAFHLAFGHSEKTLSSSEADILLDRIITRLEKQGAKIRKKE